MSVFDDPKKELEQLQAQLLEQEDWFSRELDSAKRMIGDMPEPRKSKTPVKRTSAATAGSDAVPIRNYANSYGAQTPRKPAARPKDHDREEYAPKKKSLRGLLILAALELLGIAGILGYWLLYFLR